MEAGYVYLARNLDDELCKIGFTSNPRCRAATLSSEARARVRIISFAAARQGRQLERIAHRCYDRWRVRGEWFALDAEQISKFWKRVMAKAKARGVRIALVAEGEPPILPSHRRAKWTVRLLDQPACRQGGLFEAEDREIARAVAWERLLAELARLRGEREQAEEPKKPRRGKGG
jgi:hypothetical protein